MRVLLVLAALAVAACQPISRTGQGPAKPPVGPEMIVRFSVQGQAARDLLEEVAARCWLDGVTRGAQLIVNRQTGGLVIVGDRSELLAADFLVPREGRSRVRLSGPVVADRAKADYLVRSLDRAVKTGDTFCPIGTV